MFEFLKQCDEFSLYDRAVSCRKTVSDSSFAVMLRVYFEAALKTIYFYEFSCPPEKVETENFNKLLKNSRLMEVVADKYDFDNMPLLNDTVRSLGNRAVHSMAADEISDDQKRVFLKSIYRLGRNIYEVRTGKQLADPDPSEFDRILHSETDREEIRTIEKRYSFEMQAVRKELENAENEGRRAIEEKTALLLENETLRDKLCAAETERSRLRETLQEALTRNIPLDEYKEKCDQLKDAEDRISRFSGDIRVLKGRIERAEKAGNATAVEELNEKNRKLSDQLNAETERRADAEEKLRELSEKFCDRKEVEELRSRLEKMNRAFLEMQEAYEKSKENIARENSTAEQMTPFGRLEKEEQGDQYVREQYQRMKDRLDDLKRQRGKQLEEINDSVPRCPACGKPMSISRNGQSWYCRNWKQDPRCSYAKTPIQPDERGKVNKINACWDQYNRLKEQITPLENSIKDFENLHHIASTKYSLSPDQLDSIKRKEVEFEEYPESFDRDDPETYLFQTLQVPEKVFRDARETGLERYSRFRVMYGKDMTGTACAPDAKERTIYSLILRLLNRGLVLKAGSAVSSMLAEKFAPAGFCRLSDIVDYIAYEKPELAYGAEKDKDFAERVFPEVLGKSWASYVSPQVGYDALLPGCEGDLSGQKTDLLVAGPGKDSRALAVNTGSGRDGRRALSAGGYSVAEIDDKAAAPDSSVTDDFSEKLIQLKDRDVLEVNLRYLVAVKLQHQLAVAIVKALEKGYIPSCSGFSVQISSTLYTQAEAEYILDAAIMEVEELIGRYSALYGFSLPCDLKNASGNPVKLSIGDGEPGFSGITIRDCFLNYNYLCRIEPFDESVKPYAEVEESTLTYFLNYIFGFDRFREGQVEAIRRILAHKDSIVLLATGAGKSLIYQLTGYLVPGMVVVISPLKSLISDQICNLTERNGINNITGIVSSSGKDGKELRRTAAMHMKNSMTSLLYISPERMQIPEFRSDIGDMLKCNSVYAVAVDEAHCVSEWGHDFRPAYLAIGKNTREVFSRGGRHPVLVALTGTASKNVLEDIQRTLKITNEDAVIWPETFDRNELHYSVTECSCEEKIDNLTYMLRNDIPEFFGMDAEKLSERHEEDTYAGIVFTPYTKGKSKQYAADSILEKLKESVGNYSIDRYYSTKPDGWDDRTWEEKIATTAKEFRGNRVNLLVATKAFGMGIDKENIRYVIHNGIPASLESYYQEAGRAGRDRKAADCVILFSDCSPDVSAQLLNPQLSLEDLRKEFASHPETKDDVSVQMYFHLRQYQGVEKETATLLKLLDLAAEGSRTAEKICGIGLEDAETKEVFSDAERRDNGRMIAQGIVRLINLGVVNDYEFDYRTQQFTLHLSGCSTADMKRSFLSYVGTFDEADKNVLEKELSNLKDCDESKVLLAKRLISYTYEKIETGRRRQLINMYELARSVAGKTAMEQDIEVRHQLNNYFSTPSSSDSDPVNEIASAGKVRMPVAWNLFGVVKGKHEFSKKEEKRAAEMAGRAIHELESSMGSRPDLIMVKDICQIVSGTYSAAGIAGDLAAIDSNARKRYRLSDSVTNKAVGVMYNLALNTDIMLFDAMVSAMCAYKKVNRPEMLGEIMKNEWLSEENRNYVVLAYYEERIAKFR